MSRKIKKLLLCLLSYSVDIFNGRFLKGGVGYGSKVLYLLAHDHYPETVFVQIDHFTDMFWQFFFQSPSPQQKLDTLLSTMDTVQKKNRTITEEIETLFTYGEDEQISQQKSEVLGSRSLRPRVCSTMVFIRKVE